MATVDKLNRVLQTKSDIKSAIEDKGVLVGNVPFRDYPAKIAEIEGGGGEPTPPDCWVMAKDYDFDMSNKYVGTDTKIILPKKVRGVPLTSVYSMFRQSASEDLSVISGGDNITNMSYMFMQTEAMDVVDLSNFNMSNVTSMVGMFHTATGLKSLDLSSFDTSNVTSMGSMFRGVSLESLDLSSFDTSNVTNMVGMFQIASGLKSLDLSSFDTSNVTSMGSMFAGAGSLESLDLSSFDTSNVTSMPAMFSGTSRLAVLDLSTFDMSKVSATTNMFNGTGATVGYARTQADADKFNSSSGKPARLTFVVKPVE